MEVPEDFVKDLTCPLCGGLLRDAYTVAECLHSFCKVCIYNHFVEDGKICNHSCPECHVELGVNPLDSLRQDVALQTIVDSCFPQFIEEERALEEEAKTHSSLEQTSSPPTSSSTSGGVSTPASTSSTVNGTSTSNTQQIGTATPANPGKIVHGFFYNDKVTLKLVPSPDNKDDMNLKKPYIATTGRATVKQLIQFITQSINTSKGLNIQPEQVSISFRGQVFLPENTLNHIMEVHHLGQDAPLLQYTIKA